MLVDVVFLEHTSGLWRGGGASAGGLHLRGDVADALLLADPQTGEVGLQALRVNGGMCHDPHYLWKNLRGPVWSRPATATGQW